MKKLLTTLCVCALVLVCLCFSTVTVSAADARTGKCGDNLQYSLDKSGVMTISGTGNMWDFRSDAYYYFDYHEHPWESLKPEIKSVVFKPGITYIGAAAFSGCENLTRVTFTDTITTIGCYSFMECRNLGNFTLPKNLQAIWLNAFENCDKITKVVIPDSVNCLTAGMFSYCDALKDVYIGGSADVHQYEHWTGMFNGCLALEEIKVSPDNFALTAVDGVLYNKELTCLLQYPAGKKDKTYTIQATTETIGAFAVEGNPYVEKLVLPPTVKTIENRAMSDCVKLKSINIPDGVTSIDSCVFYNCKSLTTVTIPDSVTTIGSTAFGYCSSLSSITIPDSVITIGEYAFSSCSGLTSVKIPKSVAIIGERAFTGCGRLTGIWVNDKNPNYSSDSKGVLFDKKKTEVLEAPDTVSGSYAIPNSVTAIGNYAFNDCDSLTAVTIPDSVITIGENAFCSCDNLTKVAIGSNVTTIGNWAFADCYSLSKVNIPDSVTAIGDVAFECCYKLISVTVGNGVKTIGNNAFMSCVGLISVNLPDSITTIGDNAFHCCFSLADVYYAGTKAQWKAVKIGSSNECLTEAAFHYGNYAKLITQPKNVKAAPGQTAKVTVKVTGDGLKYQWYYANKGSSSFKKLSGATKATYSVTMSSKVDGRRLYCVITDKYGNTLKTNVATLTLQNVAKITAQPKNVAVKSGKVAKVTVKATGDGLKYQWYYAKKGTFSFKQISGATEATYSVKMSSAVDGRQVYCKITDKYGNFVKTDVVTLYKGSFAKITTQPKNVAVANKKTAKVTVKATGDGLKYQWYYTNKGSSSFKKLSGATKATYSVKMSSEVDGRKVYCVITDRYGNTLKTNVVTLTLKKVAKITTQPKNVAVADKKAAKVTVKATGDGLKYQWYYAKKGSSSFKKLSGATEATYSVTMSSKVDGRKVYCKITDKYGNSVKTNVVTLTLKKVAKITTQPKSVSVKNGKTAKVTVKASGDGLTYTWYYQLKGSNKWVKATVTKNVFSQKMAAKWNGCKVYCVVKDKYGTSIKSNVVTLKMK